MADWLDRGSAWLQDQRVKFLSHMVVYQRGPDSVELSATVGRTTFERMDEYGGVHQAESRDFLIRAADLRLGGISVLPKPGDLIRESAGAQTFIYEVLPQDQRGERPPWRYSDPYRRALRIHTKLIATEEN